LTYTLYRLKLRRFFLSLTILIPLTLILIISSISIGSSTIPLRDVYSCLLGIGCDGITEKVIQYRLVRTLAALLTGCMLATSGVIIQGIARNPLAEPYILGLSSTALTAIATAILIDVNILANKYLITSIAFLGALSGYILTSTLSLIAGSSPLSLILSGIAVTALFSGISHILLYIVQDRLKTPYVYLLMGSTVNTLLNDIYYLTSVLITCLVITYILNIPKMLNAYLISDEHAKQLGYNLRVLIPTSALIASILTGTTVATVGIVGFIGLAAPHITRFILGTSDYRITIVTTMIVGSIITLIADIITRVLSISIAKGEFPLGTVTSVIGAPFLAYLIIRGGRR
jgi:iron complex transport system permease protein